SRAVSLRTVRATCTAPAGSTRVRRAPSSVLRSLALGAADLTLLVRRRPHHHRDAPPELRPATDPLRQVRLARRLYAPQVQLPRFARQREQAEPKAPSRPSPS